MTNPFARTLFVTIAVLAAMAAYAGYAHSLEARYCGSEQARNWAFQEAQARYEALTPRLDDDPRPIGAPGFAEANTAHDGGKVAPFNRIAPTYPAQMIAEGVEATCAVFMDVSSTGRAFNIAVACTAEEFEPSVARTIAEEAYFLTRRETGESSVTRRVAQPLRFCLADKASASQQ